MARAALWRSTVAVLYGLCCGCACACACVRLRAQNIEGVGQFRPEALQRARSERLNAHSDRVQTALFNHFEQDYKRIVTNKEVRRSALR